MWTHWGGLFGVVVESHDGQAALNQAVYGHEDHLLYFKIGTKKGNGSIGVSSKKEMTMDNVYPRTVASAAPQMPILFSFDINRLLLWLNKTSPLEKSAILQ